MQNPPVIISNPESAEEKLLQALKAGDIDACSHLLNVEKADPNYQWLSRDYRWGEDRNHCYLSELSRWMIPLRERADSPQVEIAELLLQAGANPDGATYLQGSDFYIIPPLVEALNRGSDKLADLLIDHGAMVNLTDKRGTSPLMMAVYNNNIPLCEKLISKHADIFAENGGKLNIFHYARHPETIDFLIAIPRVARLLKSENKSGKTPLAYHRHSLESSEKHLGRMKQKDYRDIPGSPIPLEEKIQRSENEITALRKVVEKLSLLENGFVGGLGSNNDSKSPSL